MQNNYFNKTSQIAIPLFTISGLIVISLKHSEWGLILSLLAQPFWFYSTWKSYKKAGQVGLFVTTIIMTIVISFGIINYWILS